MENASFVNMEPIIVPGDQINHTDFVGDQSKLFLTSAAGLREDKAPVTGARSTAAWPLGDTWCHVMTSKVAVYGPDRRRISDDKGSISRRH